MAEILADNNARVGDQAEALNRADPALGALSTLQRPAKIWQVINFGCVQIYGFGTDRRVREFEGIEEAKNDLQPSQRLSVRSRPASQTLAE